MAMLVQVPLPRGVAEVLLHPLPRGCAHGRSTAKRRSSGKKRRKVMPVL